MTTKMRNNRQITLRDVATATGVSINTVSRALRGKNDISPETRRRVMRVAEEMGYVNNMIASSLRLGYTNTIAVLLGDISNPFFAILMKDIEQCARGFGYASFLINTGEDDAMEREAIRTSQNKSVDGFLICPTQQKPDNIRHLKEGHIPFVLVGRRFPDIDTDFVVSDDEQGGYLATRALVERGHRRILMLNGPSHISSARERLAGHRRALAESGIPFRRELVREVGLACDCCEEVAEGLAAGRPDCTAVFAFSDLIAWGVWSCLLKKGVRVPEDYSLVGCDNIRSRLAIPGDLASVGYSKAGMARAAVELLVARMRGEAAGPGRLTLEPRLAAGETLAPPRNGEGGKARGGRAKSGGKLLTRAR